MTPPLSPSPQAALTSIMEGEPECSTHDSGELRSRWLLDKGSTGQAGPGPYRLPVALTQSLWKGDWPKGAGLWPPFSTHMVREPVPSPRTLWGEPWVCWAFGDICQELASLTNDARTCAIPCCSAGPKSRSRCTGNVCAKNAQSLLPRKTASRQPPSRELKRNAAHLQINNLHGLCRQ